MFFKNLRMAIKAGLSEEDALKALTYSPANFINEYERIGSLEKGMEADITVWNLSSTEILDFRLKHTKDLEEKLFVQMVLADDRSVLSTYVNGEKVYDNKNNYYKFD